MKIKNLIPLTIFTIVPLFSGNGCSTKRSKDKELVALNAALITLENEIPERTTPLNRPIRIENIERYINRQGATSNRQNTASIGSLSSLYRILGSLRGSLGAFLDKILDHDSSIQDYPPIEVK